MPEMAGEVTTRSLLVALGVAGVLVTAFSLSLTLAARHFPPSAVWLVSGILVGGLCVVAFTRLYLQPLAFQELDLSHAAFFLAALLGLPSATAVWVAVRRADRPRRSGFLLDALLVAVGFVLVVPIAAIVASVPDMFALFD